VFVPSLLFLEVLNAAARQWRWSQDDLETLAHGLAGMPFEIREPDIAAVAHWAGRGLTANDAAYVGLAEELGLTVITEDAQVLEIAAGLAEPPT
jgi:predicted nucleic acid-binding protein